MRGLLLALNQDVSNDVAKEHKGTIEVKRVACRTIAGVERSHRASSALPTGRC
ncbi:hypothetical protein NITMOv2_2982 [Nitrospira moscoviensis]|uniref:Uncharacterized protein n=1 Tax=Nitrospira moscoviensis TaxID=42253 RepID=A0A0K2GFL0_NITMO|nr:hypothetical protein NITMOv2_2982 [Nitrospira moscoviensis]